MKAHEKRAVLFAATAFVLFISLLIFPQYSYQLYQRMLPNHLSFHALLELASIVVSFAIALQGWNVFQHSDSRNRLYLSGTFLAVGILDLLHTLSYAGMPFFVKDSSTATATYFWILARLLESMMLLLLILMPDRSTVHSKERNNVFAGSILLALVAGVLVFLFADSWPTLVKSSGATTLFKNSLEYIVSTLHLMVLVIAFRYYLKERQPYGLHLPLACFFLILCSLTVTTYTAVYSIQSMAGHIFKVIGYYYLLQVIYVTTVRHPYLELQKQKAELETLTSSLGEGICMVEESGRIVFANPEASRLLGWTIEEMLNRELFHMVYAERPNGTIVSREQGPAFVPAFAGDRFRTENDWFRRKNGTFIPVSYTVSPIIENSKYAGSVIVFRDITERKDQERALAESERQYRLISENSLDMISKHTPDADLIYTFASPASVSLLGYEPDELVGRPAREFLHPEDVATIVEDFKKLQYGGAMRVTFRIRRKDGVFIWLESRALLIQTNEFDTQSHEPEASSNRPGPKTELLAVSRDVTDRKKYTEEIEQLSYQNSLILDSVAEGIFGLNEEKRIIFCNPAAAKMLGYRPEELVGEHPSAIFRPDCQDGDCQDGDCQMYATFKDGIARSVIDEQFYRKDGTSFPVEYTATPIRDKGSIVGLVVTFTDITERKVAERLAEERKEIDLELSLAATVQKSLLESVKGVPVPPATDIGVISLPLRELNGDFYNFSANDAAFLFGIADISGKGMPAAILMSMMKFAMDEFTKQAELPHAMLEMVNRFVHKYSDPSMFMSMFIGIYDIETSRLHYSNAGHEPALLYRAASGQFEELTTAGPVLGLTTEPAFFTDSVILEPGDTVILYTDGVIERRDSKEVDTNELLRELFINMHCQGADPHHDSSDAQTVVSRLLEKVRAENGKVTDDQTLVLFRKNW